MARMLAMTVSMVATPFGWASIALAAIASAGMGWAREPARPRKVVRLHGSAALLRIALYIRPRLPGRSLVETARQIGDGLLEELFARLGPGRRRSGTRLLRAWLGSHGPPASLERQRSRRITTQQRT